MLTRRQLLRALASASLAPGALSLSGCPSAPPPATTPPPPTLPYADAFLPASKRPRRVLEVFLWGGLNPFDTFYCVPAHGDPATGGPHSDQPWMWWAYQDGDHSIPARMAQCGAADRDLLLPFAQDSAGHDVSLGPFLYPLRDRADLVERLRVLVLKHHQVPHEGGVPLGLTGLPLGNPRAAATPTYLEAHLRASAPASLPFTAVVHPDRDNVANHNVTAAFALGLNRPSARPLVLRVPEASGFDDALHAAIARDRLGSRSADVDAAVAHYVEQYAARLTGATGPVRAPSFRELQATREAMGLAPALSAVLPPEAFATASGERCGDFAQWDSVTTSYQLARTLLSAPGLPTRYVTVVDGGLIGTNVDSGYDTHMWHVRDSSRNLIHSMSNLAAMINEPGEDDPTKLDLEQDLVLITTEFGRSPYRDLEHGLDHWPQGYTVAAMGAWADQARSGVFGAIDVDGHATNYLTPQEFRAALLLSMGMPVFDERAFAIGDIRDATSERDAAFFLRERVLGYPA